MGYYKDTGSLRSMASAEAILKKRMPEKVGILPVAELLFVAESMWVCLRRKRKKSESRLPKHGNGYPEVVTDKSTV